MLYHCTGERALTSNTLHAVLKAHKLSVDLSPAFLLCIPEFICLSFLISCRLTKKTKTETQGQRHMCPLPILEKALESSEAPGVTRIVMSLRQLELEFL